MGTVCCTGCDVELQQCDSQDAVGILNQNPNMAVFIAKSQPEDTSNKLGLSIEIPIAWEYEPVFVKTLQGDKLELRSYIENGMVDRGFDYNDKLPTEFVSEVLDKDFFD